MLQFLPEIGNILSPRGAGQGIGKDRPLDLLFKVGGEYEGTVLGKNDGLELISVGDRIIRAKSESLLPDGSYVKFKVLDNSHPIKIKLLNIIVNRDSLQNLNENLRSFFELKTNLWQLNSNLSPILNLKIPDIVLNNTQSQEISNFIDTINLIKLLSLPNDERIENDSKILQILSGIFQDDKDSGNIPIKGLLEKNIEEIYKLLLNKKINDQGFFNDKRLESYKELILNILNEAKLQYSDKNFTYDRLNIIRNYYYYENLINNIKEQINELYNSLDLSPDNIQTKFTDSQVQTDSNISPNLTKTTLAKISSNIDHDLDKISNNIDQDLDPEQNFVTRENPFKIDKTIQDEARVLAPNKERGIPVNSPNIDTNQESLVDNKGNNFGKQFNNNLSDVEKIKVNNPDPEKPNTINNISENTRKDINNKTQPIVDNRLKATNEDLETLNNSISKTNNLSQKEIIDNKNSLNTFLKTEDSSISQNNKNIDKNISYHDTNENIKNINNTNTKPEINTNKLFNANNESEKTFIDNNQIKTNTRNLETEQESITNLKEKPIKEKLLKDNLLHEDLDALQNNSTKDKNYENITKTKGELEHLNEPPQANPKKNIEKILNENELNIPKGELKKILQQEEEIISKLDANQVRNEQAKANEINNIHRLTAEKKISLNQTNQFDQIKEEFNNLLTKTNLTEHDLIRLIDGFKSLIKHAEAITNYQNQLRQEFDINLFVFPVWFKDGSTGTISWWHEQKKRRELEQKSDTYNLFFDLNLQELGQIKILIMKREQNIDISIAANKQSISIIRKNLAPLRERLNSLGLKITNINTFSLFEDAPPNMKGTPFEPLAKKGYISLIT